MATPFSSFAIAGALVAALSSAPCIAASFSVRAGCGGESSCDVNGVVHVRAAGTSEGELRVPMRRGLAIVEGDAAADGEVVLISDTHWAPVQRLNVVNGTHALPVWPAAYVSGRFAMESDGEKLPETFRIEIQSPPAVPGTAAEQIPPSSANCAVASGGTWTCVVPQTRFDAVLRVKSFTPHYRWNLEPRARTPLDLGRMLLRPAASAIAWLDAETLKALKKPARARLIRLAMSEPSELSERLNRPVAEAQFNERGMVQLSGVPPGEYTLEADAPGFATARIAGLRVFPRSETKLTRPIRLEPPLDIRLTIVPAVDASNAPWRLEVSRREELTRRSSPVVRGTATAAGTFELLQQPAGTYAVFVTDARGSLYASREIVVHGPADAQQTLEMADLRMKGKVRLGGKGLAAELLFGGNGGSEQISAVADGGGEFSVILPRAGEWTVDVTNREEAIRAAVIVVVKEGADELEINVPATEVAGSVVGPDGQRCRSANVAVNTEAGNIEVRADDKGDYRVRGLAPGRVRLIARDRNSGETSNTRELRAEDGNPLTGVDLQLLSEDDVTATVWSQGQPVAGARVSVTGAGDGHTAAVRRAVTDLDGAFTVPIKVTAAQIVVLVAAAGRTMQAFSFSRRADKPRLELEAAGGTLQLDLTHEGASNARLDYSGIALPIGELLGWARAQGKQIVDHTPFVIPNMAPGPYQLCFTTAAGANVCRPGTLARGATLELATK